MTYRLRSAEHGACEEILWVRAPIDSSADDADFKNHLRHLRHLRIETDLAAKGLSQTD